MRPLPIIFSAIAILCVAAGDRWAEAYQFEPDNYFNACGSYLQIPNDNPGTYYLTLPDGPTATVDGAIWLDTGSGPALKSGNLAVSIYYKNTSSDWQLEETMFCGDGGYAGYFFCTADPTWGNSRVITNPLIVSTDTIPVLDLLGHPNETFQQGLFYLQFWTDPALASTGTSAYSTYAQARTASATGGLGVYVAQTAPFKVDFGLGGMSPLLYANVMGMYMPAAILKSAAFVGDANGDGTVDVTDLSKVLTNYNGSGMHWTDGDFDGNGTVDVNDLSKVLTNYNRTAGSAAGPAAVPEPGTLILLAAGLAGLTTPAWRKRK